MRAVNEMFTNTCRKVYYWHMLVALIVIRYAVVLVIEFLQYRYISQDSVPSDLSKYIIQEQWDDLRVQLLQRFRVIFALTFANQALQLSLVGFGLLSAAWNWSARFFSAPIDEPSFKRSVCFSISYYLIKIMINVPLQMLNDVDVFSALKNEITSVASFLIIVWILRFNLMRSKWLFASILMALNTLYTLIKGFIFIPHAVMKTKESFPTGKIKTFLQAVLSKVGFPNDRLLLEKDVLNAYTTGLGKHGVIVLGEKLIQVLGGDAGIRKIAAVVYHELGHWHYNHIFYMVLKILVVPLMTTFVFWYLIDRPRFYQAFDIRYSHVSALPLGLGIVLVDILMDQGSFILSPILNYLNWIMEYQADGFAVINGYAVDLKDALLGIMKDHPSSLATFSFGLLYSSHPVTCTRIPAIEALAAKMSHN